MEAGTRGIGSGGSSLYSPSPYTTANVGLDRGGADRYHLGVGELTFYPRIALLAIKEDNIFLSNQEPVTDSYLVLSPGLLAGYGETQKKYAYVDFTMDVPVGFDEDTEDVDNLQVTTVVHVESGKSTIHGQYKYRNLRSGDIVIGNRVTKEEHILYGGYDHVLSRKTGVGVNASYSQHDFASQDFSDYTDLKVSSRMYWKLLGKSRLFGQASVGEVAVDSRVDAFGDADYVEGSIGLDSQLSSRWNGSGTLGYQIRDFDRKEIESVEGITSAFEVNGRLLDHIKAGLVFSSLIQPAVNEAGATLTETRLEPSLSRRIWIDELVASGSAVWGWVDYDSPDNQSVIGELETPLVFDGRKDKYKGYTLSLDWHALHQFVLRASYSYIENDTNRTVDEESSSYEAERWVLRAQYGF